MKPTTFTTGRLVFACMILAATLALVSWDFKQSPKQSYHSANDTVPETKKPTIQKKILDLDDVLDELNAVDIKLNMENVQKELKEAMKEIDAVKIQKEVQESLAKIDMEKVKTHLEEIKNMDMSKVHAEMEKAQIELSKALKELDAEKIQHQVQESLSKIDMEKLKVKLDEIKNMDISKIHADMEKAKKEMEEIGPKLQKEMENAKVQIEKAKQEVREYKEFVNGLQSDGLINKKEGYTIKHRDGELIVNDKKVSEQVYTKYRSFLEKHKKFTIEKSDADFNIDTD